MIMKKTVLFLIPFAAVGCKPKLQPVETKTKAIGDLRYIHSSSTINVCFEDLGAENSAMKSSRQAVADYVSKEFSEAAIGRGA